MPILILIGAIVLCSCVFNARGVRSIDSLSGSETEETATFAETTETASSEADTSATDSDTETLSFSSSETETTTKETSSETKTKTTTATTASTTKKTTASQSSSSQISSSSEKSTLRVEKIVSQLVPDLFKRNTTESSAPATQANGEVDYSCFENSAFVGNSRLLAVGNYGFAKHVYAKVGLNVKTVFTEKCEGSSVTVIDELNGKNFDKVFLMFGDNECGWGSMDAFERDYGKVVKAVKERVPNAKIYLISVLPISKSKSAENEFGCNKDSIEVCNKRIMSLAQKEDVAFINAAESLADSEGYLPDDLSTDGVHMGKKGTGIWLSYVARHI